MLVSLTWKEKTQACFVQKALAVPYIFHCAVAVSLWLLELLEL
jgi:hypothetical protein